MMSTGRSSKFPFTASQWQELEHQALIFKYMASGIPIPPDLLLTIKTSSMESSLSSRLFPHQPHQFGGWNYYQMGLGKKVDPEPGRCRRTDGKKWRCSKEAYPDSKYCERHMHRGKNRSRKPVEAMSTPPPTTTTNNHPSTTSPILSINNKTPSMITHSNLTSLSEISSETQHEHPCYSTHLHHPFYYTSSTKPLGIGLSSQNSNTHLLLDSGSYSQTEPDFRDRYVHHGLKEDVDEHAFFSEASGTMRSSSSGSSMGDFSLTHPKQRSCSGTEQSDYSSYLRLQSPIKEEKQDQHFYGVNSDFQYEIPFKMDREDQPQKTIHRFFDEWPPKNRDSWLNLDDKSSNCSSSSTTQLSISTPTSSHVFPIFNNRTYNDG